MKKSSSSSKSASFIWLPPRSIGEKAFLTQASCIVMQSAGSTTRYHRTSLDAFDALKSATLILDGRDVTLLSAKLPALAPAKLAKALPNVVEDLLLQDVNSCALVIGPRAASASGETSAESIVGAVDKQWLDFVIDAIERRGVRVEGVVPAHLVLPLPDQSSNAWALACYQNGLAVRTSMDAGFGWGAGDSPEFKVEAIRSALLAARQATAAFTAGESPALSVYVEDESWQAPATTVCEQTKLQATISSLPVPRIEPDCIDFLGQRSGSKGGRFLASFDWRAWRVPLLTTAAAALCFVVGLNLHWGQLAQEKQRLKSESEKRFRQAFPQTQVVVDPLLQMQRNVSGLRAQAGQAGPEDFTPLLVKVSSALASLPPVAGIGVNSISGSGSAGNASNAPLRVAESMINLEYRSNKLRMRFMPGVTESRSNREAMVAAAARYGIKLDFENDGVVVAGAAL